MIIRRKQCKADGEILSVNLTWTFADVRTWLRNWYELHSYVGEDGERHPSTLWADAYNREEYIKGIFEQANIWMPPYKRGLVINWAWKLALRLGYIEKQDNDFYTVNYERVNIKPGPKG